MSGGEKLIYDKLSQQKLEAEINILSLRANKDKERIKKIDEETYTFFESKPI